MSEQVKPICWPTLVNDAAREIDRETMEALHAQQRATDRAMVTEACQSWFKSTELYKALQEVAANPEQDKQTGSVRLAPLLRYEHGTVRYASITDALNLEEIYGLLSAALARRSETMPLSLREELQRYIFGLPHRKQTGADYLSRIQQGS